MPDPYLLHTPSPCTGSSLSQMSKTSRQQRGCQWRWGCHAPPTPGPVTFWLSSAVWSVSWQKPDQSPCDAQGLQSWTGGRRKREQLWVEMKLSRQILNVSTKPGLRHILVSVCFLLWLDSLRRPKSQHKAVCLTHPKAPLLNGLTVSKSLPTGFLRGGLQAARV